MSILEEIIQEKHREIASGAVQTPLSALKVAALRAEKPLGFAQALSSHEAPAIIAEIKRASPSKGMIREDLDPVTTAREFSSAGAACLSVLTDQKYFHGHIDFIRKIRSAGVTLPVLRKDFMVDEYQLYESRAAGADAILLIVAALSPAKLKELYVKALSLELDVLMEVHTEEELAVALALVTSPTATVEGEGEGKVKGEVEEFAPAHTILGINNRNLNNFVTELSTTGELISAIPRLIEKLNLHSLPSSVSIVSESGIYSATDIIRLIKDGASGFLIGESLVKVGSPGEQLSQLINETRTLINQSNK